MVYGKVQCFRFVGPVMDLAMRGSKGSDMSLVKLWFLLALCAEAYGAEVWWKDAVFYRLNVDSFKDGDGDGLGDLMGAMKQISYVKALGVDAVILSPLVARSTDCSAPGIVDITNIDNRYGTLEQFTAFMDKAKKLDLKVLMTLPIQTVSAESESFNLSATGTSGYEDFVYWRNGESDTQPPAEEGITWKWQETRNAWYPTRDDEVVMNLCSLGLSAALSSSQCAWIRRGLSGFVVVPDFAMEPSCAQRLIPHMMSSNNECARTSNFESPVILIESSLSIAESTDLYAEHYEANGVVLLVNDALTVSPRPKTPELALRLHAGLMYAEYSQPVWLSSTWNESRIATRYGADMVDTMNLLALTLPGSVVVQQGDELGSADAVVLEDLTSSNGKCWPNRPTPSATPFPWDDTAYAGFSAAEPWLPLAPNFRYANARTQFSSDASHVGVFRVAAAMRRSPAMGPHVEIARIGEALSVLRWGGVGTLLLVCNPSKTSVEVQLSRIPGLPREMTVAVASAGSTFSIGSHLQVDKSFRLASGEAVLFAGPPRHCGGPGAVDKITNKLSEGWQKLNKYFGNM